MATALTDDMARGWSWRVPQLVIAVGLPATVAVVMMLPADDLYYSTVADVVSVHNFVFSMLSALALAAAVLAWAVPRVCLWVFVIACLLGMLGPTDPHEVAAGGIWLLVAALDGFLALRQSALAAEWDAGPSDPPDRTALEALTGLWRWESWGIAALALVAAAICLGWWVQARADLIDFNSRAVPSSARITDVDTFDDSLRATVGGKAHDFWVNDASAYAVGDRLPIRVDPRGDHPPMGLEDADPDGIDDVGPLVAPLLLLGLLVVVTPRHRDRARLRLLTCGRALSVQVRPGFGDGVEILTSSGTLIAVAIDVIAIGAEETEPEECIDETDGLPILAEGPRAVEVDLSALPPGTDLDSWLDGDHDDEIDRSTTQHALVYGLERYGRPVVIQILDVNGTSMTLLPARPVRDPHTIRALAGRVAAGARLPGSGSGEASSAVDVQPRSAFALMARRTHVIGPLACLIALWFVARWLSADEDIDPLIDGLFAAFVGASLGWPLAQWYGSGRPVAHLGRWGVLLSGTATDRLLPDHRIVGASAGQSSVSIELRCPDERVGLILDPDRARPGDLDDVIRAVTTARRRAGRPPHHWRLPSRVPSAGTAIIAAATITASLATALPS